jgi:hypothetical protein
MDKIEHTMCTKRNHNNPKRRPEAEYCHRKESSADQRLENKRMR